MENLKNKTIVFAHRGYPKKYAENSLEGFRKIIVNGAEGVEFDVHLTKDGVPVVLHDEKVDRTTDGQGWLKDYTLEDLRKLHLSNGEPIPTLAELLALLENKDIMVNLEFKTNEIHYPNIEGKVLSLVKQYHFVHPVIFSSFDYVTLKNCQEIDPQQIYCYLTDQNVANSDKLLKDNNFAAIHPCKYQASSTAKMQRIWTVDDPQLAKRYFKEHVAGIFTNDYPLMIKIRDEVQG